MLVQRDDFLIAFNTAGAPIEIDLSDYSTQELTGNDVPSARVAGTVREFVVAGDTSADPHRIRWSAYRNHRLWTPSVATQAGFADLPRVHGVLQAIVSGVDDCLLFQRNAVHRLRYVGPPTYFELKEVSENRGAVAPDSVCRSGQNTFYYSDDGFRHIMPDGSVVPIGTEVLDRWYRDNFSDLTITRGVAHPTDRIVNFSTRREEGILHFDGILSYRWDLQRWGYCESDHNRLVYFVTPNLTPDALDVPVNASAFGDISMDSPLFQRELNDLGAFTTSFSLGTFVGDAQTATFETNPHPFPPPRGDVVHPVFSVSHVRPMLSRGLVGAPDTELERSVTIAATGSMQLTGARAMSGARTIVQDETPPSGNMSVRMTGRFMKLKADIMGGFDAFGGFVITGRPRGRR